MIKLEKYQGAASDISSGTSMLLATIFGMPVSSSQSKSMAIAGVGSSRRLKSVNWNVIRGMLTAWIVTFPCCILLGYVICKIIVGLV